jgi:hypothetical protein
MCLSGSGLFVGSYVLNVRGLVIGRFVTFWYGVGVRQL